jgi:S-(hydroxymethyl)mycothiol dehydrogenase
VPQEVRAVIARAEGEPVSVQTIVLPDPGPHEVVVRVETCGVCHTDLHYREGGIHSGFPFLLGHEAAGRVETVGDAVTTVSPGDRVVLAWRAPCGTCRACRRGRPWYCFDSRHSGSTMTLQDGTPLSPALGLGAFAEKTLVGEGACVKVDERADPAAAGLLGCGVMAGWGAAVNTAPVRIGDTVAVLGCGGVGDAAIAGAVYAGARQVIAVDLDERKLQWARGFGATDLVHAGSVDVVEELRRLTGGFGPDVVIDAVGRPETFRQAFDARDLAGTVVLVGVPTPAMVLEIPLIEVFGHGGAVKSSWYGDCLPSRDFPLLVDLFLQGRFPLDAFVSERIGLDDVEEAFARMGRGEVLRSVVVLDGGASS